VVQLLQLTKEDLHLEETVSSGVPSHERLEIQSLLSKYSDIFVSKVIFPPPRPYSHIIL
jgi:hypothetical protein